ncbi:MAG: flagellar biosynthesis anti-sigma factor FlgM [Chromatiaceae bacterium]|nr:flagellar biosynthesis anti-sigma factor FlgM [Gammaproteobacteria bacterium]MCP5301023.1 flagellar biosynthesis anti-sigma factor FlgM [Chromatiaceae bacterium]MCP5421505.1 flagellar biosynthesis anti-sigma factor FlgM [Chromatiaceae bacterium]
MGIEINGNCGRPSHDAVEAAKSQSSATGSAASNRAGGSGNAKAGGTGDQVKLSSQASQLQALEAQIANLPVVDTQRVQEVQHTIATGALQVDPARVADKLLTFEAGLGQAK